MDLLDNAVAGHHFVEATKEFYQDVVERIKKEQGII